MNLIKPILFTLLFIGFTQAIKVLLFIVLGYELFDYYLLSYGTILLISMFLFVHYTNKDTSAQHLSTDKKWYLIALALFLGLLILKVSVIWIYKYYSSDLGPSINFFNGAKGLFSLNSFSFLMLIPIANELFFRGFIQKKLQTHTRPVVAIVFSSLLFATVPYSELMIIGIYMEFYKPLFTFLAGLILGTLYYKSKALGPSIVLHILIMISLAI
ncbi:MAG TPA: type II CAAX endopeptidase family protein [Brumimicrobium sp.]|nr:type II CAAX endopeptidase family protein [Brumimicrobium sp.]